MRARFAPLLLILAITSLSASADNEIGFIETFSLAEDRSQALEQLIPGTDDYYYYHCLHYQNTRQRGEYDAFLSRWIKEKGYNQRVKELRNRQALLDYESDTKGSLKHVIDELDLHFNHRRQTEAEATALRTALDEKKIATDTLLQRALKSHQNLQGFEDAGLHLLAGVQLNAKQRRHLLERLQRPDYPGLVDLVLADLKTKGSRGFGHHPIHARMLLAQLDELAERSPEVLNNPKFVNAYLARLHPGNDVDLDRDVEARAAYLDRLWAFAAPLDPVHNSLKANILYHRLVHDRDLGLYDRARFMEYIRYPRPVHYVRHEYLERSQNRHRVDLKKGYEAITLSPIGNEEPVVREYLEHSLVEADDYKVFAPFIREEYLKRALASAKILNGVGDAEQWATLLKPSEFKALRERIDLDFAAQNTRYYRPDDPVALDLYVKNVKDLIVKVFEINVLNYYREKKAEVDLAINLDGLVASHEKQHTFKETPFRRVRRTFEFPELNRRGVFVVEFIGNGRSSRALIQKGRLTYLDEITPAGHGFTILDEDNRQVRDAALWVAGREYLPQEDGVILVPFTTEAREESLIIRHGHFASHATFSHQAETYKLSAGFYVDREALLKGCRASVLIKPVLQLNARPVSLELLEDVTLSLDAMDRHGVSTHTEIPDFALYEDRESVHDFRVPDDLASVAFTLRAKIQNVSRNKKEDLLAEDIFELNGLDGTAHVDDQYLTWIDGRYVAEVRGKNGEPKPDTPLNMHIKHRFFRKRVNVTLKTDAAGRCSLGVLPGIDAFQIDRAQSQRRVWKPDASEALLPSAVHGVVGETLSLPFPWNPEDPTVRLSLLEQAEGREAFVRDHREALAVREGMLEITGLAAGDYSLYIEPLHREIAVRITRGQTRLGYALSDTRALEQPDAEPLAIRSVVVDPDALTVSVANATPFTRVHVAVSRFLPEYSLYDHLSFAGFPGPSVKPRGAAESLYVSGRNIGDEYRYILNRQYAKKYPGNMLQRPGLLLNPWAIQKTEAGQEDLRKGEAYDSVVASMAPQALMMAGRAAHMAKSTKGMPSTNLDFLRSASVVLTNLRPDADGVVRIPRDKLAGKPHVRVLAVDQRGAVCEQVSLADSPVETRDLRLARGLDPEKAFAEQKRITVLYKDVTLSIPDMSTSSVELYDSIPKVYQLFSTLRDDKHLKEFSFVQTWPDLSNEEKQELYAKYACHELSFFLYHKDPDFFASVVKPYLANKKDKTFLDHWLLGDDLSEYLQPWAFNRLNIVERIFLGRRITEERPVLSRHVNDLQDLIPEDISRFNHLFDTAVKAGALEISSGTAGFDLDGMDLFAEFEVSADAPARPAAKRAMRADSDMLVAASLEAAPADLEAFAFGGAVRALPKRAKARAQQRRLFQQTDKTEELVENNYYRLPIEQQAASLVTVNAFWNDFAAHDSEGSFLSSHIAEAAGNFSEMMLALAVLDLPFSAPEHEIQSERVAYELKPAAPLVAFHKEIREASPMDKPPPILISQNFFRADDRYEHVGNEQIDKYVTDEFLRSVTYGAQVVLTNPTGQRRKLTLLLQIPRGAMPVDNGFYTRGHSVILEPFATAKVEYSFYFPAVGSYAHYPAQVALNGEAVARATPFTFNVVEQLSRVDTTSWPHVSQYGSDSEVLAFLESHNLNRLDLELIAWRMKDRAFFRQVLDHLDGRHVYHGTLWSYGLHHNDLAAARTYLQHSPYAGRVGDSIDTLLLTVDPVARHTYQHMEYEPLVNPRAHSVSKEPSILNHRLRAQYQALMKVLSYRQPLDHTDRLAVSYYLLLQDRIEEGLRWFDRVDPEGLPSRLQYDYMTAYVSLYQEDLPGARALAERYADYPVPRWRNKFVNLLNQLQELDGAGAAVADAEDLRQTQDRLAATEPNLELGVEAGKITLRYANLGACKLNFYPMDIELLFSRNPFIGEQTAEFSYIRPARSQEIALPAEGDAHIVELPRDFRRSNVMVEAVAGGLRRAAPSFAHALDVQVIENYGQVRVRHAETGKALPKVYIKAFARMKSGGVRFFKDGYTDFRGRFDYASLNSDELQAVKRLSLLILSEEHGAVIREAAPPKR